MASDTDITIPELPASTGESVNDLFLLTQPNAQSETGYSSAKATMERVAKKILGGIELPTDLPDFPANEQNPIDALEYLNSKILDLYPVDSASGPIANFTTSLALPLVDLKAYITAQGGGGTPSAPVAIVGWDNVKIYQRGVNLWDEEWEVGTFDNSTGEKKSVPNYWRSKNRIKVLPNTLYYAFTSGDNVYRFYYDARGNYIGTESGVINSIFTTPNNAYYLNIVDVTRNAYDKSSKPVCINYPSTDTQYHAYNPNSTEYTIQLGQTCYGGYIDKSTGKLTITHVKTTVNPDNIKASGDIFTYIISDMKSGNAQNGNCNRFTIVNSSNDFGLRLGANNSTAYFYKLKDNISEITDTASCKTWFTNNPVDIVYPLDTLIETDITIPDITALVGENNIFADSGDIDVSFKMGVQEYIDKKIAETQALVL